MRITKPRADEPVRLITTKGGDTRYRVVIDVTPKVKGKRRQGTGSDKRRQVTRTFPSITAARAFVERTKAAVEGGTFLAPSSVTLRDLTEDWLRSRRNIREVSRQGYRQVMTAVLDHVGHRQVQSFTRRDVEALVEWMETAGGIRGKGLSHRSQVYTLGALRQVFAYGLASDLITRNPAEGVTLAQDDGKSATATWTPSELLAFRAVADGDPLAAAWRLTLCGLRRSEVLGLRWANVDLSAGTVKVVESRVTLRGGETVVGDAKSKASRRTVPVESMHPGTVALLRALSARQAADRLAGGAAWTDTGLVVTDALGVGVSPDTYSSRFRDLSRVAEVPAIRLHAVRHTVATMLHEVHVAPAKGAALLGHTLATHLTVYVQSDDKGIADAGSAFGEVLATANG